MITNVQLPACDHCGRGPVIENMPGPIEDLKPTQRFFVICKSDECAIRKDNGLRTIGRVLSDGMPSQNAAEEAWKATARTETYRQNLAKVGRS